MKFCHAIKSLIVQYRYIVVSTFSMMFLFFSSFFFGGEKSSSSNIDGGRYSSRKPSSPVVIILSVYRCAIFSVVRSFVRSFPMCVQWYYNLLYTMRSIVYTEPSRAQWRRRPRDPLQWPSRKIVKNGREKKK